MSDGLHVVRTDAEGRYALPGPDGARVFVVRPAGHDCDRWYRRGGGDFALRPRPSGDEFLFVQLSDAHVFDRVGDFRNHSLPPLPSWLPGWLTAQGMLFALDRFYADRSRGEIVDAFRRALAPHRDVAGAGSSGVLLAYLEAFEADGAPLGHPAELFRAALAEIAALAPAFAVSTGDLVLDANAAPPAAVRRWFELYRRVTRASGIPFYDTLGNNELVGTSSAELARDHPAYGRGLFQELEGPSHYSFDRGGFHFVALDTHREQRSGSGDGEWVFDRMEPRVRDWLERDLAAHEERVLVVLNHEPFHTRPEWRGYEPADDEGIFERRGVDYVLAGHVHRNGSADLGGALHVTTGALSGMRWVIPTRLHPRGYRLFYAREGRLYSAWKELGEPALGFLAPPGDPALHPTAGRAGRDPGAPDVVAVAVDRAGPFARLALRLDGAPLASERWGDYFLAARLPAGTPVGARLELRARDAAGRERAVALTIPRH